MPAHKALEDADVRSMETNLSTIRMLIQHRLNCIDDRLGIPRGSLLQVDDSGMEAIGEVTQYSSGLALEVMKLLVQGVYKSHRGEPYIINRTRVEQLGLTYERLCEYWDNPLRKVAENATFMHM